ncbi:MAG: PAS domain-containing protein [Betaproteobacteria bacterium]|nr:PAS domain-containing protein [Betaproteobacteria bacterium]
MSFAWVTAAIASVSVLSLTLAFNLILRLRLGRLAAQSSHYVAAAGLVPLLRGDALATIRGGLDDLHAAAGRLQDRVAEEVSRRRRLNENLRETEERYALAVSGGNDGMWEWNLKTGAVFYSPRWKSMLGNEGCEIGGGIDEWHSRIHPEDRERALAGVDAHLQGHSVRFENEHRLRHRDGRYRWVLVRAQAVRHANGTPYRMLGLTTDIASRHQVQQVLLEVADGLADLSGQACYQALVGKLADLIGVKEAFLTECSNYPTNRLRMLAFWIEGKFAACEEFDLANTPCQEVIQSGRSVFVPRHATARWPEERRYGTEGYLGLPCLDTKGRVIGHIACKSRVEMQPVLPHHAILKLFAVRASVEMERQWLGRERRVGFPTAAGTP